MFGEKTIKRVFYCAIGVSALAYIASSLTVWKFEHLIFGLVFIVGFFPLVSHILKDPENANMSKAYWTSYIGYLVFLAGFAAIFFIF